MNIPLLDRRDRRIDRVRFERPAMPSFQAPSIGRPEMNLPKIDLSRVDMPDLSKIDLKRPDLSKLEMPSVDLGRIGEAISDAMPRRRAPSRVPFLVLGALVGLAAGLVIATWTAAGPRLRTAVDDARAMARDRFRWLAADETAATVPSGVVDGPVSGDGTTEAAAATPHPRARRRAQDDETPLTGTGALHVAKDIDIETASRGGRPT